jgi:hypothetical protein
MPFLRGESILYSLGNFGVKRSKKDKPKPENEPNWAYWASKEFWSADEASALLITVEPGQIGSRSEATEEAFNEFRSILHTLHLVSKLDVPIRPIQLIEYLDQQTLSVPTGLRRAVLGYERNPANAFRLLAKKLEAAEKENRELKLRTPLDPRERKTLLSLVCGLVHVHHRYNPSKRSSVVKDIQARLRDLKIHLSDDAIRSALNAAYDLLPDHLVD